MKAMTIVIIWVAVALRPWKRTCDDIENISNYPFVWTYHSGNHGTECD
jgi:hypothetical protein